MTRRGSAWGVLEWLGVALGVLILAAALAALVTFAVRRNADCEARGGVLVRSNGGAVCIARDALR